MKAEEKVKEIISRLEKRYPNARIALNFSTPLELLIATILSAQCTDARVNQVTQKLFKKYKTAEDYATANVKEFEKEIKSTGFYKNKAKNIIAAAKIIVEKFNGKVPDTMEELLLLPGVGRKTANIVLGNAYKKVVGIAVDTHVLRLSQRLGLSKKDNSEDVEKDLMKIVPKDKWFSISYLLIDHGREVCKARKPLCGECVLSDLCSYKKSKS
jgi:endonuclease-3